MNIALITDFGTRDYFVGAMKGVILSINKDAKIIDITHEIPPQDIRSAGFNLHACYRDFPRQTIFVAIVDPGVGSKRRAILVQTESYYFVAPDNGLLSFIYRNEKEFTVYELTNDKFFYGNVSKTFHGRDVFAPVAAHLSAGIKAKEFGKEIKNYTRFKIRDPKKTGDGVIEGEILHIDQFGNIVTNIHKDDLPKKFTLYIGEHTATQLRQYFSEGVETNVPDANDNVFMIFGSLELLEVVVYQDSAARILNVNVGEKIYINV